MSKRLLSLLLVLAMVLSMMPMGVLAEGDEGDSAAVTAAVYFDGGEGSACVSVSGWLGESDRLGLTEVTVLAVSYDDDGRMTGSDYETAALSDGAYAAELRVEETPEGSPVQVYLLRPDLQPITGGTAARWCQGPSGMDGEIRWELNWELGSLSLYGAPDKMPEMSQGTHGWDLYQDQVMSLTTENVKSISEGAFADYAGLSFVELGEGLETIGASAFAGDSGVMSVYLPASLRFIGENAFDSLDLFAYVEFAPGFDGENVTVGPGNDTIEFWMNPDWFGLDGAEETAPEATEETVPETTLETVPEAAEETVPEITEETQPGEEILPEPAEEALTAEEAAAEGYYIAPEGARLQEAAAAEEVAVFNGTDKAKQGLHTASFTGLVPGRMYALVVSRNPGSLKSSDLQYFCVVGADGEGSAEVSYLPRTEDSAIVQLYGPERLTLTPGQDYVVLHPGEECRLKLTSNDESRNVWYEYDESLGGLSVSQTEDRDWWLLTAEEGFALAETQTRYVEFVGNMGYEDVRVRVRVDLVPKDTKAIKAELGESKLTYNIYDSAPLEIPVRLTLREPENAQVSEVSETAALEGAEDAGRMIKGASFTNGELKSFFDVDVKDDHTLLLRVKDDVKLTDAQVVKAIKGSYKTGFMLELDGQEPLETGAVTLTLQKKLPTIKAQAVTLNPYYQAKSNVTFTGGTVTSVEAVTADDLVQLKDENGNAVVSLAKVPGKTISKNLTVWASVEGYATPVKVTIPVKVDAKAPALKLKQTTWTVSSLGGQWIDIPVQSSTKGVELETLDIRGIEILGADGKVSENYAATSSWDPNSLGLCAIDLRDEKDVSVARPAGKENLTIRVKVAFQNGNEGFEEKPTLLPIDLKLTVVSKNPVIKLSKSQVTLNCGFGEQAFVTSEITLPSGSKMPDTHYYYHNVIGKRTGDVTDYFELRPWRDGTIGINLDRDAFFGSFETVADQEKAAADTYTMYIDVADNTAYKTWTKLTIRLSLDLPTVTAAASGSIDLNNDLSAVTITPSYKGMDGCNELEVTVLDSSGNDRTGRFQQEYDEKGRLLLRTNPADRPDAGKYTATVKLPDWANGSGSSAKVSFNVAKTTKLTAKVTGKMDSGLGEKYALITPNYNRKNESGLLVAPKVTLWTTGKNSEEILPGDDGKARYHAFFDEDTGTVRLSAATDCKTLLAPGKYTAKLKYPDRDPIPVSVTVVQTAPVLTMMKSSVTIHPYLTEGEAPVYIKSLTNGTWDGYSKIEYYQSNGKTQWTDGCPVQAEMRFEDGYLVVTPVKGVEAPSKDTTVKIKLTPDNRIPNKFTWLTVKVLGGKNLTQKVTLKALKTIDPSVIFSGTEIQTTLKGFDNRYKMEGDNAQEIEGSAMLLVSKGKGNDYQQMRPNPYDTVSPSYVSVEGLNPADKYRLEVTYRGSSDRLAASGTVDLKVAYGSNKFTVAKAPTLYKTDPYAAMDIHLNAKDQAQQIEKVTIKGSTDFVISRSMVLPDDEVHSSQYDWVLRYTGDPAKLKTTTLTLQIFLKGNTTEKPNFTTNVKVTVK